MYLKVLQFSTKTHLDVVKFIYKLLNLHLQTACHV